MQQPTTCRRRPRLRRYKSRLVSCPANSAAAHDSFFPVRFSSALLCSQLRQGQEEPPASVLERRSMTSSRAALLVLLLPVFAAASAVAQLDEKFYSQSCPSVEDVVRKEMVRALSLAPSLAGPLLRMHFHDCFVRVRVLRVSLSHGGRGGIAACRGRELGHELALVNPLHAAHGWWCRDATVQFSWTPLATTRQRRTRNRTRRCAASTSSRGSRPRWRRRARTPSPAPTSSRSWPGTQCGW
jgi:hypothetical protein